MPDGTYTADPSLVPHIPGPITVKVNLSATVGKAKATVWWDAPADGPKVTSYRATGTTVAPAGSRPTQRTTTPA